MDIDKLPITVWGNRGAGVVGQDMPDNTDHLTEIDGVSYTDEQIKFAITACRVLAAGYAAAGASGSVNWSDVDDAHAWAKTALGHKEVAEIETLNADNPAFTGKSAIVAQVAAELGIPVVDIKKPDDTEGGSCD
jgi:hypothetical protein